ncbi:AraC family transcriptional regulator [Azoarcus olearius]|uniref:AraC-family transcriptional regulator n=1 Tax=Azoarcus sp. (strain BH72) TaxID=418699 RepID=A1K6W1_AZOSB|nr:AraC family transcriptional regulator [Azoarcus olearius]ANQ85141.1 AraC family transcriptional regulator [Azoarcus olearius]CAL94566.1 putative AraC-family transcriptional regulator [Azoarcus olearius]
MLATGTAPEFAPPADPALARFPLFETRDVDEARVRGAQVFCDHKLQLLDRHSSIDARMCFKRLRGVGIGRMTYGAHVAVEPGCLEDFLLVQMPLSGAEILRSGDIVVNSSRRIATVASPQRPFSLRHEAGTEKLFVRIDRDVLERHCLQHLGHALRQPLEFRLDMPLDTAAGQQWMRALRWLVAELDSVADGEVITSRYPLLAAQFEQMLISMLLVCQPHNYSEQLQADAPSIAPAFVKRVERYIEDNAHEPLTIVDLAAHAGVSSRSLFAGFKRYRDTTPMLHLREVRLRRVREALLEGRPGQTTVTSEAMRWGFSHLGHFTAAYKRRFGESPSETLARG